MSYEPRFDDEVIEPYVPENKDVSELSDSEREAIEEQYELDTYLDDEYYKRI